MNNTEIELLASELHFALFGAGVKQEAEEKLEVLNKIFTTMGLNAHLQMHKISPNRRVGVPVGEDAEVLKALISDVRKKAGLIGRFETEIAIIGNLIRVYSKPPKKNRFSFWRFVGLRA